MNKIIFILLIIWEMQYIVRAMEKENYDELSAQQVKHEKDDQQNQMQDELIEIVPVKFPCRLQGNRGCRKQFTKEEEELKHLVNYHKIIAALYTN